MEGLLICVWHACWGPAASASVFGLESKCVARASARAMFAEYFSHAEQETRSGDGGVNELVEETSSCVVLCNVACAAMHGVVRGAYTMAVFCGRGCEDE
jgi:hypothetical protein